MTIESCFINNFKDTEDVIGSLVQRIKDDGKKVVLFGTGYCLSACVDLVRDNEIEILALCDNDEKKWGMRKHGIEIRDWESLQNCGEPFGVFISTSHFEEIEMQLRKKGFLGKVYHLPKDAYFKNVVYGKNFLKKHEDEFQLTFDLLEDEISKIVFINIIKHNISLDNRYYKEIEDLEICGYFGMDLYINLPDEIILDCGAFDGDTYREFISDPTRTYKEYIAYEPDEMNFRLLKNIKDKKLTAIQKGLGEEYKELRFSSGMGTVSSISEEGNIVVKIDAIDNLRPHRNITFVKMDIEGAERAALLGGQEMIRNEGPVLAVSAYHKKEDMYDLIQLIRGINDTYKFYMRHTFFYEKMAIQPDVIIYAMRREDSK